MSKDFRASQIETSKLIASGGIGSKVGLVIYSGSIASDRAGNVVAPHNTKMLEHVGDDVFLFVSGTRSNSSFTRSNVALFGGDVVVSGTLYAERQVIEVDGVVDGDMIVTASLFVEPDANSTKSVVFRRANGTDIFVVNSLTPRVQITGSVGINGQIQQDSNQLILNANHEANINTSNTPLLIRSKNIAMLMSASLAGRNFVISSHRDSGNSDIVLNTKGNLVIRRHSGVNSTNEFGQAAQPTLVFSDVSNADLDSQTNLDGAPGGSGTKLAYIQKDASNNLNIVSSNDIKLQIDNTGQAKNILLQPKNIDGSNVIINDDGLTNPDFRVESNTLQGAILVDGADDTIVLGSNVTTFAGLPDNAKGTDVKIVLSGTVGTKGTSTRGVTLMTGDAMISGSLDINTVSIKKDGKVGIGTSNPSYKLEVGGNAAFGEYLYHRNDTDTFIQFPTTEDKILLNAGGKSMLSLTEAGANTQVLILSGGGGSSSDPVGYTDTNFFVSGSIGSRGTAIKGTSVFGGDVVISGTLHGGSPLKVSGGLRLTGSLDIDGGLTGSLQEVSPGKPYLLAGTNIQLATASNGQITVSSTAAAAGAGGANTQVIFNNSGAQAGDANFTFNSTTDTLSVSNISGSLTKLANGTSFLVAGTGTTISSASNGQITISSTGTSFTAGDGLDLGGSEFSVDLKSSGGLKIDSTELAVEPSDFAGTGLEDDGSDNLRISAAAAGDGLQGGAGSALAVDVSDFAGSGLEDDGSENLRIASSAAGTGLTGGGGSALSIDINGLSVDSNAGNLLDSIAIADNSDSNNVKKITLTQLQTLINTNTTFTAGDGLDLGGTEFSLDLKSSGGLKIDSTELAVEPNDFAGTGLEDDGSDNLRIATTAAGTGLTGGGGSALSIDINGLSADSNAGNLSDSIAIADNSDSNNVKKITLTQLQTLVDTNTTYTAGTGLDLTSTEFSVDVSDFMTNGANNRIVTATGTDAMNAEANLTFDGTDLSVSGKVKTTGLEYTDGDEAITVQDAGYIKYNAGVTHSPAVKVNADNNGSTDQWIKIAEAEAAGTNGDTIITNLLVNICGNEGPSDDADDVYATFLIHAEFTAKSSAPYYYPSGTKLYVDVFNQADMAGFNPTSDIFISFEEDSTPVHALYIKSKEENKDVYVTHLGGTDTSGGSHTDPSMKIVTGQNWETSGIDAFNSGKAEIYGIWASKILSGLTVVGGTASNDHILTIGVGGDDNRERKLIFEHAVNKTAIGIDDSEDVFAINCNSGGLFSASNDFQMDGSGNVTLNNGSLTLGSATAGNIVVGSDQDGYDRTITFGHSTLKSVIGIDDSADVFAINTDAAFESGNDLEIDTSGNVTIGNGDLIVGNMTIESTGNEITTSGNMLFDTSNDITLDADGGNIYLKDAGTTNINITLAGEPGLYATGDFTIDTDSALIFDGASGTSFKESGTQRMLIENASGDVAIGSHAPDYRLDVQDNTTTFVAEITNENADDGSDMLQMVFSGQTDPDGWIIYVKDSGNDRIYGVIGDNDGTSSVYTTFTGFHDTAVENNDSMIPGMIVESTGIPWAKNTNLNYHNVLPYSRLTNTNGSKSVFGVLARDDQNKVYLGEEKINNLNYGGVRPGSFPGLARNYPMSPNHTHVSVMSLGEGAIWVTNIAGNIENGDLIESSVVTGYGRLQSDDIMRSKTVAKCTEDIDWVNVTDTIQHEGVTYKKYLTACTFHCG